ncbi:hypothetical protein B1A99_21845 [Cohnella sp. CIP 111063]|uniref:hypothetical protein n=1 Tax=unclassified Cohnella TaxID=2636738 RepID=UPI000B8C20F2|nr:MULTISPECIES: hypothetical protein [unclassified Cohnella]OXS55871.1 hypothetical protein B1A99_21845 [Cohnella sp. CIP 111063]PRX67073.1 hypothetical protein B0G52_11583 [Cohnella sp. SGD-V74]
MTPSKYYPFPIKALKHNMPLVIYETGIIAEQYIDQLEALGMRDRIQYCADTFPSKRKQFRGIPVLDQQQIAQLSNKQEMIYVVASYWASFSIADTLRACGIDDIHIVMPMAMEIEGQTVHFPLHKRAIRHIVIYPFIETIEEHDDMEARLNWFLPNRQNLHVYIPQDLPGDEVWQSEMDACDVLLVWRQSSLNDALLRPYRAKIGCVDPSYMETPELPLYARLYYRTLEFEERAALLKQSMFNFERLQALVGKGQPAYVFGSGPSLETVLNMQLIPGVKIICNAIVQSEKVLDRLDPDVLVAIDAHFFSHTIFGQQYRETIKQFLDHSSRYCIVPEMYAALLFAQYPELRYQIIGMPITSTIYHFPVLDSFWVKSLANVITTLAIPIASSLADTILIAGCDGSSNLEEPWDHSKIAQWDDTVNAAHEAHTSYRLIINSRESYHEQHNRNIEELIALGEQCGKTYHSITPSFIPALARRFKRLET